jgi:hypothetical protein
VAEKLTVFSGLFLKEESLLDLPLFRTILSVQGREQEVQTVSSLTVNNFLSWPHSGVVMRYSRYVEPRDSAASVLLSSQQETVACLRCSRKESRSYGVQLSASGENRECRSLSKGKTSICAKN